MEDKAAAFLATSVICLVITWIFVPLRCYARLKVVQRLAAEDWTMVAAALVFTLEIAGCFVQIHHGFGSHQTTIDIPGMEKGFYWLFVGTVLYATVMALIRISIGLLLLRLMANRIQKLVVWVVMFVSVASAVIFIVWTLVLCKPISHYWQRTKPGYCNNNQYVTAGYVHSAGSIFSDWILAILPMWVLYQSKLSRRTKAATAGILGLGALASISTLVRFVEMKKAAHKGFNDFTYTIANVLICSVIEQGLTILAGCFATFRPLFTKIVRPTQPSEGTRGRPGRPPQPGDTKIDWDPGLTIGFIGGAEEDEESGSLGDLQKLNSNPQSLGEGLARSDSRAPLQVDKLDIIPTVVEEKV